MNLRRLLVTAAVLHLLFGVGFVLNPELVLQQHGMTPNDGFRMMMRPMGGALIALGMIFWWVRHSGESAELTAIVRGGFLFHLIAFAGTMYGMAHGVMNTVGWSPTLIHLVLAIGFGVYSFRRASTPVPAG